MKFASLELPITCTAVYIALLVAAALSFSKAAWAADSEGKFPGKGDIHQWQKASTPFNEGVSLLRAAAIDKAIEKFKAAIEIYPYDSHYFTSLGLAYKKKNQLEADLFYERSPGGVGNEKLGIQLYGIRTSFSFRMK